MTETMIVALVLVIAAVLTAFLIGLRAKNRPDIMFFGMIVTIWLAGVGFFWMRDLAEKEGYSKGYSKALEEKAQKSGVAQQN